MKVGVVIVPEIDASVGPEEKRTRRSGSSDAKYRRLCTGHAHQCDCQQDNKFRRLRVTFFGCHGLTSKFLSKRSSTSQGRLDGVCERPSPLAQPVNSAGPPVAAWSTPQTSGMWRSDIGFSGLRKILDGMTGVPFNPFFLLGWLPTWPRTWEPLRRVGHYATP